MFSVSRKSMNFFIFEIIGFLSLIPVFIIACRPHLDVDCIWELFEKVFDSASSQNLPHNKYNRVVDRRELFFQREKNSEDRSNFFVVSCLHPYQTLSTITLTTDRWVGIVYVFGVRVIIKFRKATYFFFFLPERIDKNRPTDSSDKPFDRLSCPRCCQRPDMEPPFRSSSGTCSSGHRYCVSNSKCWEHPLEYLWCERNRLDFRHIVASWQ